LIIKLTQIIILIRKSIVTKSQDINIVQINKKVSPYSFFNFVFINKKGLSDDGFEKILTHEKVHARQYHSLDLILFELLTTIQWFNPFFWLLKKSLIETHEYLADTGVIKSGITIISYQELIFEQLTGNKAFSLSNKFSKSQIKRRLAMMNQTKTKKMSLSKYLLILPLLSLLLIFFSCKSEEDIFVGNDYGITNTQETPEKYPEPKGGSKTIWEIIRNNIKMPEEAKKNNVLGEVDVFYIVESDGKISNIKSVAGRTADGKWAKKLGYGCDEEAIRLVKMFPDYEPAIYKGKPIRMSQSISILFGDQEVWNAKNPYTLMTETILTKEQKEENKKARESNSANNSKKIPNFERSINNFDDFPRLIAENVKYPDMHRKNNISGTVYSSFVIDESGNLVDIKIEKGINKEFDEEVLRAIRMLPNKGPARDAKGRAIKYKLTIPVKFALK
jgi:TonB family protein